MNRLPNYGIRSDYKVRNQPNFWDDRSWKDQFQKPVYEYVKQLMLDGGYRTVLDIGTGSGYKLVTILGQFDTIGTELSPTYEHLRQTYPDRKWLLSDLSKPCPIQEVDVVMAADVIEHLQNPDQLLDYIATIRWKKLVLSTPDRDQARGPNDRGPPQNPCHAREWNAEEFRRYVAQWFPVRSLQHFGATMVLTCEPPSQSSSALPAQTALPSRIFLVGYPGDVGGAGTECWHTLLLWRRFNLQVVCIPTWGNPCNLWLSRVNLLGYPTITTTPDKLADVPGLKGSIVVSFCNSQFLAHVDRLRDLGCRIVWAGCMCWLFDTERRHYERRGPFDAYVFQSQYQLDVLRPQLAQYGVRPEQMHLVRAAFMTEEWPFRPRPHKKGEPLVVGRISRPAPDKFHPKTWWIYERIPHPIRARIMAWGPEVEKRIGPPPPWAEVLPSRAETAQDFIGKLHVMLQANGGAQENWPRSGLEAMATGVPLVVPNQWGWREMVRHGFTGFLADTEEEMAYYAARLAYEEDLRQFFARAARKHLIENLARPETIWAAWQKVFQSLQTPCPSPESAAPSAGLG